MSYPFDIKKVISSYILLHDRLGYKQFDKNLLKQLLQPRDEKGHALKMPSYYYLPKKVGGFRQFGFNKNCFFLRRSKLDFQFIVKQTFFESVIYCHIDMFPQYENTKKLQSIMMHPDLLCFLFPSKVKFWTTQDQTLVSITWSNEIPLGYHLPTDSKFENYPNKMKQEARDIICKLINKSIHLKKFISL